MQTSGYFNSTKLFFKQSTDEILGIITNNN